MTFYTNAKEKGQTQEDFIEALKDLLSLDYTAVEAYEAAIQRVKNEKYKRKLDEFRADHLNHIKTITNFLKKHGHEVPTGPGLKKIIVQGKVLLANIGGDGAILKAMKSNAIDTSRAYQAINTFEVIPLDFRKDLLDGFEDEKRHLMWIEEELDTD